MRSAVKSFGVSLMLLVVLAGCAGSPVRTSWEAEENRGKLLRLEIGQSKERVLQIMGQPYLTEAYDQDGKRIEFWLYMTEGRSIDDRGLSDRNFTPLAFEAGVLKGWGRNYYDNVLRIKKDITVESK